MSAMVGTIDGKYLFMALEDVSGNQLISRLEIDTQTFTVVYNPGGGDASNVLQHPTDPDRVYFYGWFGGVINVVRHIVSTGINTEINVPSSFITVNALTINPSDSLQLMACLDDDQEVLKTVDGGSNWTNLFFPNFIIFFSAMVTLWSPAPALHRMFISGNDGDEELIYTPSEGFREITLVPQTANAFISGMEFTEND